MFGKNLKLFEIFGFKVQLNLSWVFLALLIAFSLALGFFPQLYDGLPPATYWWMAIAAVIGLFFSIVFHELSHSIVARQFGMRMRGITLFIFGGMAEMEQEPPSPKAEFYMAIAGPASSLVLAGLFYLGAAGSNAWALPEALTGTLHYLGLLNLILAVFNLLPAFPLDGGRALRAALWWRSGNMRRATSLAARIGAGFGWGLIGLGIFSALTGDLVTGIWWFLIGMFIRAAAKGSFHQLELRTMLEGEPVRRFMSERPISVPPDIGIAELVEGYVYRYYHDMFPVTVDGQLLGAVDLAHIKELPREKWPYNTVRNIMTPKSADNSVTADEDAMTALSLMQRSGKSRLLVTDRGGELVGVIALKDVLKLLALRIDLEPDDARDRRDAGHRRRDGGSQQQA